MTLTEISEINNTAKQIRLLKKINEIFLNQYLFREFNLSKNFLDHGYQGIRWLMYILKKKSGKK